MIQFPYMPLQGECSAPSFDSTSPHDLPQYFTDLEYLFKQSDIKDLAHKKFLLAYFVDLTTRELWQSLPQFSGHSSDKR